MNWIRWKRGIMNVYLQKQTLHKQMPKKLKQTKDKYHKHVKGIF